MIELKITTTIPESELKNWNDYEPDNLTILVNNMERDIYWFLAHEGIFDKKVECTIESKT